MDIVRVCPRGCPPFNQISHKSVVKHQQKSAEISRNQQKSSKISKNQQKPAKNSRNQQKSAEISRNQQKSLRNRTRGVECAELRDQLGAVRDQRVAEGLAEQRYEERILRLKMMEFCIRIDEFCIKNDGLCNQNGEFRAIT